MTTTEVRDLDVLSYVLYPQVYLDFEKHQKAYDNTSVIPTPAFFYGLKGGEEITVEIEPGKTLIIKFLTVGDPHADGSRTVFFELNGQPREVPVMDRSLTARTEAAATRLPPLRACTSTGPGSASSKRAVRSGPIVSLRAVAPARGRRLRR